MLESFRPQQGAPLRAHGREKGGARGACVPLRARPGAEAARTSADPRAGARARTGRTPPSSSPLSSAAPHAPLSRWRRAAVSAATRCWRSVSPSPPAVPLLWILAAMSPASWCCDSPPCPPGPPVCLSALPPGPCRRVAACCCELRTAQLKNSRPRARSFRCCVEAASSTGPTPPASSRGSGARLPRSGSRVGP